MYPLPWRGRSRRGKLRTVATPIDTLEYARLLREAGFSEELAHGQARALGAVMNESLATKEDLETLRTRVEARFEAIEARVDARFEAVDARFGSLEARMDARFEAMDVRLDARLADMERRLTVRMGSLVVASIGVVSAVVRML